MNIINKNKGIIVGLVTVFAAAFGLSYWAVNNNNDNNQEPTEQTVVNNPESEDLEEIIVIADKADFAEKANEAAVANQVNAAVKLSEDSDDLPVK
jgi:flagellar basal body-associated protein FliL